MLCSESPRKRVRRRQCEFVVAIFDSKNAVPRAGSLGARGGPSVSLSLAMGAG